MGRKIINYFFISLLVTSIHHAYAQQYNFKHYTPKNGLPNSTVNNILQDSKGYIWFATQGGGISKFNGKTFKNYTKADGLIANDVTFITEDKEGNIWIATTEGVSKFDGAKFYNYTEKDGLSKGVVYWIYADPSNIIWFAIQGGGVNKFNGKSFTSLTTKNGLPTNDVYCILQDNDKNYWFGLSNGIAKYNGTRIVSYDKHPALTKKVFFSAMKDSKGNLWFGGVNGNGVVKYNGAQFESLDLPSEVKNDFFGSITEDNKGNIWFATEHGILKLTGRVFQLFGEQQGLSSNNILSLCKDYEGNIWIGTLGGGVNLFNNESFVNYTEKDGLKNKNITAVYQLTDHMFLLGSKGGEIEIYDRTTNSFSEFSPQVSTTAIYSFCKDDKGNLWIGTHEGVYVLKQQGEKFSLHRKFDEIKGQSVKAAIKIIEDKQKNIWIATYGSGVVRISDKDTLVFNSENGLSSNNILSIYEDVKSNIWLGTVDAGAIIYNGKSFKFYGAKEGLADKTVWSITEDIKGNIYFGTGEAGVGRLRGNKFNFITTENGLSSNHAKVLLWDKQGNALWVCTEKGLNKLKFKDDLEPGKIRHYNEKEGFNGEEVNENAILIDKSGLIWFGTYTGLSRYDRKYDFLNITPPKLDITEIRFGYSKVDWKEYADSVDPKTNLPVKPMLSYNNNNLTFHYRALTTDNVKYSFILEGMNYEWSPLTSNTEAIFTNISPGKRYTFKVKAINSDGVWSRETKSFVFTISPPWWKTWWFRIPVALFIVGSVIAFFRYRTAALRKRQQELEQTVREKTAEVVAQKEYIEEKNKEITDSINYAWRIQNAILPPLEEVYSALPNSFILYKPKAIVSGDFYWFSKSNNKILIAAADCTGHGVPGAFMSSIGSEKLNEAAKASDDVSVILNLVNRGIKKVLRQTNDMDSTRDGMDVAICAFNKEMTVLEYAAANRPLWIVKAEAGEWTLAEIKATKVAIGGYTPDDQVFTKHTFDLQKGETYYIFSDGYADQFNPHDKKLMTKKFKDILLSVRDLSMVEQKEYINTYFEDWKNNMEQTDDVLVIGIKI